MDDANVDDANGICFPYDVLLGILRRLPGRPLAKSRLVCRAWRAMVDAHGLLLQHVFPLQFPGVFSTYYGYWADYGFFAPPTSRSRRLPADADDEPRFGRPLFCYGHVYIQQHCNGLLLLRDNYEFNYVYNIYVINPATKRFDRLPPPPAPWRYDAESTFLAFDPAMSRHHEVFLVWNGRTPPEVQQEEEPWWVNEGACLHTLYGKEEPEIVASSNVLHVMVFSSRTCQWEGREFVPGRCSSRHLYDLVTEPQGAAERTWWSAEYWRGSLYIHCHGGVLLVLRSSEGTYDIIQLPGDPDPDEQEVQNTWTLPKRCLLANYERGVHYVVLNKLQLEVWVQVQVWVLTESSGELGWTLTHKADLRPQDHVSARIQPEMRWEVVDCWKRDLRGSVMNREIRRNNEAILLKYNNNRVISNEVDEEVQDEESYDESEELESREGSRHSWDTDEDSIVGVDGSVVAALGLEEDNDDETTIDGSEYSWNSDEHNFIDMDEITAATGLGLEEEYDDNDNQGWGCRIVGFHPHKNVLLLHLSHVVVAYHLDTSRMQYLGYMFPNDAVKLTRGIHGAFPYRPCFIDALPI